MLKKHREDTIYPGYGYSIPGIPRFLVPLRHDEPIETDTTEIIYTGKLPVVTLRRSDLIKPENT